ncbi:MAG: hypothetical protein ACE3L7_01675 [Candidatus Pristimantibacillus sp.]
MNRKNNDNEKSDQLKVLGSSKVKLLAPSLDGGPDREVKVVYERKAVYGRPSFLKLK